MCSAYRESPTVHHIWEVLINSLMKKWFTVMTYYDILSQQSTGEKNKHPVITGFPMFPKQNRPFHLGFSTLIHELFAWLCGQKCSAKWRSDACPWIGLSPWRMPEFKIVLLQPTLSNVAIRWESSPSKSSAVKDFQKLFLRCVGFSSTQTFHISFFSFPYHVHWTCSTGSLHCTVIDLNCLLQIQLCSGLRCFCCSSEQIRQSQCLKWSTQIWCVKLLEAWFTSQKSNHGCQVL